MGKTLYFFLFPSTNRRNTEFWRLIFRARAIGSHSKSYIQSTVICVVCARAMRWHVNTGHVRCPVCAVMWRDNSARFRRFGQTSLGWCATAISECECECAYVSISILHNIFFFWFQRERVIGMYVVCWVVWHLRLSYVGFFFACTYFNILPFYFYVYGSRKYYRILCAFFSFVKTNIIEIFIHKFNSSN